MDASEFNAPTIRKFNPGTFQSDKEVVRQFVVRKRELGLVLDVLHENIETPSCQHVLLVAPRGRGKTMLLARVAAELRNENELSQSMLPVRFMEESHEVFDIADFWLETLFYLSKEIVRPDPDLARELQAVHADLTGQWRDGFLAERARATVLDASDRLGKKLVLMIENMQTLFDDVDENFGWQLRETLQTEPQIILIGTATSRFERLDDVREPFFELFRILDLKPLDTEACRRLWQVVSGDDFQERRIRPLQILTGGNPRLLVIIAEFARHRSLHQLMEELVTLVDEHTEYFRGHLEALAPTERRVYLAVIDLWQPSTTGEIAARARMDVRSVSSLLGRLIDRGAVTYDGTSRKREYAAAERLYSIYYKMRRERDEAAVVHNLIHFMAVFYSEDELTEMSKMFSVEATRFQSIREGFKRARLDVPQIEQLFSQFTDSSMEPVTFSRKPTSSQHIEAELNELAKAAEDLIRKADDKVRSGEPEAATSIFDSVVDRFSGRESPRIQFSVAKAMVLKGMVLGGMGRLSEALTTFNLIEDRFHTSEIPQIELLLAESLVNKGFVQRELGQLSDANSTLESITVRFSDSDTPKIRKIVADALILKANVQVELDHSLAAIGTFDEIVERYDSNKDAKLIIPTARALVEKGMIYFKLGDLEKAVEAFEDAIVRFDPLSDMNVREWVARALFSKAMTQRELDTKSAIVTYDEFVERFGAFDELPLKNMVVDVLFYKAETLYEVGNVEASVRTYDEFIALVDNDHRLNRQVQVATAMINRGVAQWNLDNLTESISSYDLVIERFGSSELAELQEVVVKSFLNKGMVQGQNGRSETEIATYDEVIDRFGSNNDSRVQLWIAKTLINKGVALRNHSDYAGSIETYDRIVDCFGDNRTVEFQQVVLMAMLNKAVYQLELDNQSESMTTYNAVIERAGAFEGPWFKGIVAKAWVSLAYIHIRNGSAEEAQCAYEAIQESLDNLETDVAKETRRQLHWIRISVMLIQKDHTAAMKLFHSLYASADLDDQAKLHEMIWSVVQLITTGASETDVLDILLSDEKKAEVLSPLVVALQKRKGLDARVAAEVNEVAEDILRAIEDARVYYTDRDPR
ncbi:MAG: tetratricopeptide repeat protein [Gemmatimonadetes bacterium]|nr:tetratricopeptide repeat protein [Gemmatimonadota bacterium]